MARKTVLITGASSGIGAATALLAARMGYDVAIHYKSQRQSAALVAQLCDEAGSDSQIFQADLSDPAAIEKMFAAFDVIYPRLDALVNNAGIVAPKSRVDEMSPQRLSELTQINLIAPILMAKEAILRMSRNYGGDGGSIVNISSAAARNGAPGEYVDYAATKGGLDTFTKGLALEVADDKIRVNGVRPGIIETGIHAKGGQPDRADDIGETTPLGRAGSPEEVASAILYLLSPEASYITGTMLDVAGGR